MNNGTANWTLVDNAASAPMTVPWVFSITNGTFNFGAAAARPSLTFTTVNSAPIDNQIGQVSGATGVVQHGQRHAHHRRPASTPATPPAPPASSTRSAAP